MAKNDYFVIAYRILSYLYECFMTGENADVDLICPAALGISEGYWTNTVESLYNEGYLTGVVIVPRLGGAPGVKVGDLKITQKGIEFLLENSTMAKAKEIVKTIGSIKSIVPGL